MEGHKFCALGRAFPDDELAGHAVGGKAGEDQLGAVLCDVAGQRHAGHVRVQRRLNRVRNGVVREGPRSRDREA